MNRIDAEQKIIYETRDKLDNWMIHQFSYLQINTFSGRNGMIDANIHVFNHVLYYNDLSLLNEKHIYHNSFDIHLCYIISTAEYD